MHNHVKGVDNRGMGEHERRGYGRGGGGREEGREEGMEEGRKGGKQPPSLAAFVGLEVRVCVCPCVREADGPQINRRERGF